MIRSFAYGSSLDIEAKTGAMREPDAASRMHRQARNYRLAFTRWSTKRQCGCDDAVSETGNEVWGVVFQLSEAEQDRLDQSEGYDPKRTRDKNAYVREEGIVYRDENRKQPLRVQIYFLVKKGNHLPDAEYKGLILRGARHHKLPASYISQLEKIAVSE